MTIPRFPSAGAGYMVQRRIVARRFYLKPTPTTNEIFLYVLAYVLQKYRGISVHEFVVLSNHYHLVLTDHRRELPKFMQDLDSLCARAINATWGMFGTFWEHEQYSAPRVAEADDLVGKCVYALGNPCEAGLVAHPFEWPGVTSWHCEYGEPIVAKRPAKFFSARMPEEIRFTLARPAVALHLSDRELRRAIRRATLAKANAFAKQRRAAGRGVLGMARVCRQPHQASPQTRERRFVRRSRVSSRSRWAKAELEQQDSCRRAAYREALARFCAGDRTVEFPPDTYLMRVRYGCACASP